MQSAFCAKNSACLPVPANSVLLDTGPLAALFNPADHAHRRARDWFKACTRSLHTTDAVVTELSYFLSDSTQMQTGALRWLERAKQHGHLTIHPVSDHDALADLLERYADLPCDYADASLISLGNALDIRDIATLDERDFSIYRLHRNRTFKLVFTANQPARR